ncbi:MAG: tRNA (guanosine(37)-N1)-methyltransferase TrmD [Candidatus Kapaibacterium sp.]
MRIDILTAVPDLITPVLDVSIIGRAVAKGVVDIHVHNLHDFATDTFRHIDDAPYGGGAGMVLQCEPVMRCIDSLLEERPYDDVIYMTPEGVPFTQAEANRLSLQRNLILLAGHYKGIDQRIRDLAVTREISVGDYVVSGGELPALIVTDAIVRLLPGAISDVESALDDSFQDGLLAPPVYTRPAVFRGLEVPPVLRGGDHEAVRRWRHEQSLRRTAERRPDLLNDGDTHHG